MTRRDWKSVIVEAARTGVQMVQFIGGEPTLHPDLPHLIDHAVDQGIDVEVFSNLVHISAELWEAFDRAGVSLATSWYAADPAQHREITGRNTFERTKANIIKALERSIPVRAGIIEVTAGQGIDEAGRTLSDLGVREVGVDVVRRLGRGHRPDPSQLCGQCGDGVAAIGPSGDVWPCPLSRWVTAGNVRDDTAALSRILAGRMRALSAELVPLAHRPDTCKPKCIPDSYCNPTCTPGACRPRTREMAR